MSGRGDPAANLDKLLDTVPKCRSNGRPNPAGGPPGRRGFGRQRVNKTPTCIWAKGFGQMKPGSPFLRRSGKPRVAVAAGVLLIGCGRLAFAQSPSTRPSENTASPAAARLTLQGERVGRGGTAAPVAIPPAALPRTEVPRVAVAAVRDTG